MNKIRISTKLLPPLFVMLAAISPTPVLCEASQDKLPEVITNGIKAYQKNGPEAAISEWIKGSPYEGSKDAMSQASVFRQVETFYGKYLEYHTIGIIDISPSTKIYYLEMDFDKGPVYAKFMMYKAKNDWLLSGKFNFHTEPQMILPSSFFNVSK